jgi:hypothetical protein
MIVGYKIFIKNFRVFDSKSFKIENRLTGFILLIGFVKTLTSLFSKNCVH